MIKRLSIISITIWFMWACLPSFVSAHAYLSHSTPLQDAELQASPGAIKLTFTEKIDTKLSSITLVKAGDGSSIAGKLSADGDMTLIYTMPKLDNGEYKVVWQVLSLDTHITDGSFRFAVGSKLAQTKPDETASLDGGGSEDSAAGGIEDSGEKPAASSKPSADDKPQPSAKPKPSDTIGADDSDVSSTTPPAQSGSPIEGSATVDGQKAGTPAATETPPTPGEADSEATSEPPTGETTATDKGGRSTDITPASDNSPETNAASEVEQEMLGTNADGGHNHAGGEHDHAGGLKLMAALRIADVLVSALLASLLFFRYCIWRDYAADAPICFTQRAERLVMAVAVAVWLATGLWRLTMLSNDLGGIPLQQIATGTMVGKIAVLRPLAAALLLLLAFAPAREQRFANIVKTAVAVAIIVTFPLTGHAYAELTDAGAAIFAHAVHMGAAAIWLGGLAGLVSVSLTNNRQAVTALKHAAERFSLWAFPSMMLIIVSGVWLSAKRLSSWKQLVTEDYGSLILIKSGLLLLVLVIGAMHRVVFMPRLAKAQAAGDAFDGSKGITPMKGLLIGVRLEILLAAALFVLAGMLSTTSPPSESAAQAGGLPFYWHVMGEQAHMTLRIDEDSDSSGSQKARLHVWLPEGSGPPKTIVVSTVPKSDREADSKQLPQAIPFELQPAEADAASYPGFIKYTYEAAGAMIDASVNYVIKVDIIDALGNDFHYERQTNS